MIEFITPPFKLNYTDSDTDQKKVAVLQLPNPDKEENHSANKDIVAQFTRGNTMRTLTRGSWLDQNTYTTNFRFSNLSNTKYLEAEEFFTITAPRKYVRLSYFRNNFQYEPNERAFAGEHVAALQRIGDNKKPEQDWICIFSEDNFTGTTEGSNWDNLIYSISLILRRWHPIYPLRDGAPYPTNTYIGPGGPTL